ncbi:hypothetical protein ACP70R_011673 [Stipagrostis hirtigluma subsp. patula]
MSALHRAAGPGRCRGRDNQVAEPNGRERTHREAAQAEATALRKAKAQPRHEAGGRRTTDGRPSSPVATHVDGAARDKGVKKEVLQRPASGCATSSSAATSARLLLGLQLRQAHRAVVGGRGGHGQCTEHRGVEPARRRATVVAVLVAIAGVGQARSSMRRPSVWREGEAGGARQ